MAVRTDTTDSDSDTGAVDAKTTNRRVLAFEALKIRNYRFLLASDFFQMIGFNTRMMVQDWIVLELTNSDG
jgi:hypothetical protein